MKASPWDGKIKDFKLEPASFSQMVHCLLVLVLVLVLLLVLVLVVRLGHHDGWMIAILLCPTFPLMTSTLTCYRFKFQVHFFTILFSPSVASFWHTDGGWPEKTWENIPRVFTRGEKAGQTNHLNLYCSTFLCQTVNLFSTCFNAVFLGPSFPSPGF